MKISIRILAIVLAGATCAPNLGRATDIVPNPAAPGNLGQNTNAFPVIYGTNVHAQTLTFGDGTTQTTAATGGGGGSGTATNLTGSATNQVNAQALAQAQAVVATNVPAYAAAAGSTTNLTGGATSQVNALALAQAQAVVATNVPTANGAGLTNNTPVSALGANSMPGSNAVAQIASAAVALAQTNLAMPQLANRWNIPVPDASWDAALQLNNGTNLINANLVDDTGNPNNTLIAYPTAGAVAATWNATAMNGQPGILVPINQPWSNNVVCASGLTNFTFFIVYRDVYQAYGQQLWGNGVTGAGGPGTYGTYGMFFEPYDLGNPADNGSDSTYCNNGWTNDLGRGAYVHIPARQNQTVECAAIRAGCSGDPTFWQDGNLFEPLGYNCAALTYLTNTFILSGIPNIYGWYNYYGWIGEAKLYDRALSDQDMQRLMTYYRNRYKLNDKEIILGSDSITAGNWAAANSNLTHCLSRLMPTYEIVNNSIAGIGSLESYTNLVKDVSQGRLPGGSYYIDLCGANDVVLLGNEVNGYNAYTNYTALKAAVCVSNGIQYLPVTHYSSLREEVTYPGFRTNVNNWIYANWQTIGAAGIVDLSADPRIGPLGSYTNGAWINQADQIHLVTNSYPLIYAPAVAQAILGLNSAVKGTFTNSTASFLTSGAFQTMPAAGFVSASVIVTNTQIVWLTNATSHYAVPMGNITGTSTTWDSAVLMVNSGDSVCLTNISGTGGAQLTTSTFQALK